MIISANTVYWESSAEEKVCEFCESGNIRKCFLALFNLGWNFYILDCLNHESFLANYGKDNLRNFFSADDSRYTVYMLTWLSINISQKTYIICTYFTF